MLNPGQRGLIAKECNNGIYDIRSGVTPCGQAYFYQAQAHTRILWQLAYNMIGQVDWAWVTSA